MSSSPREPATRRRPDLRPLSTFVPAGRSNAPVSALSMSTPHSLTMPTATSAIQPYNPREWVPSSVPPPVDRSHTFPGSEPPPASLSLSLPMRSPAHQPMPQAQPSPAAPGSLPPPPPPPPPPPVVPPPPYSPPRSRPARPASTAFDHGTAHAQTHAQGPSQAPARFSTSASHRPSTTEPHHPRSFLPPPPPPPPGPPSRAPSRERLFGVALGRRRGDLEQLASSPEPMHQRQSAGPSSYFSPDSERISAAPPSAVTVISPHAVPPASRRAASTGAIGSPHSARSRSGPPQTAWEPGMPIPPPPPRPPPSAVRSQSVQRVDWDSVPIISPPTRRRPPCGVTSLGPVPPTPADWVEEGARNTPQDQHPSFQDPVAAAAAAARRSSGLRIDVGLASNPDRQSADAPPGSASSTGGLTRSTAVRNDKTIIERRTESRGHHGSSASVDLSNIVVPTRANGMAQRIMLSKSTPHSADRSQQPLDLLSQQPGQASTPRERERELPDSAKPKGRAAETPPFSPSAATACASPGGSRIIPPKSLPTPPLLHRRDSGPRSDAAAHHPPGPGSAALPLSREAALNQSPDEFAAGTIERFRAFAAMESAAATDADRVRLFADFIVSESRIRRERHAAAIGAMGSEIFDLTRDLFRPMGQSRRASGSCSRGGECAVAAATTPAMPTSASASNYLGEDPIDSTPRGERFSSSTPSSADFQRSPGPAFAANRASNYRPCLSPILSMSVSDNHDDSSSRGRQPSRWWEVDSQADPGHAGFERSKRESKYMGVPKDQWLDSDQDRRSAAHGNAGEQRFSSEYPPEKVSGGYKTPRGDESSRTPYGPSFVASAASTPSSVRSQQQGLLDVSRLVTLPPPYPRHHPAVNNNHPELSSIRTVVRALSQLDEINQTREAFAGSSAQRRQEHGKAAAEGRQAMRARLQQDIGCGSLSYADAAAIESEFDKQENMKKKELEKTEYEAFQNQVVLPLNEALTQRISRATELYDDLARHMFDNGEMNADMPQEEGDDRPELLEKLTLLKWIFEQRETLHRAIYDLLTERNRRYRDVVLTPYRLSGNAEKLESARGFFAEDAAKRGHAFASEVLGRAREVRGVMEEAVGRGVELQLSAYWDIAPPLCRLLEKIPGDLEGFGVRIPAEEYEENPAYHEHPLQYLYSLLLHAEKSSYQFIEAQTNQLCLLHEVKEAVTNARTRALALEPMEGREGTEPREGAETDTAADRERRAQQMREAESRRLTEDLQEKVRTVQEQWESALGEALRSVKERVGEWLLSTGGWDEAFEDGGVRPDVV